MWITGSFAACVVGAAFGGAGFVELGAGCGFGGGGAATEAGAGAGAEAGVDTAGVTAATVDFGPVGPVGPVGPAETAGLAGPGVLDTEPALVGPTGGCGATGGFGTVFGAGLGFGFGFGFGFCCTFDAVGAVV
jgi:hypothetical protein